MKRIYLLAAFMAALIVSEKTNAKVFRVGFAGKQVAGVDFAQLDGTVLNAASPGDTIQLYQYSNINGGNIITKKLVLIGFGFMLDKNPGLQATPIADNSTALYFNPGSEGSIVEGLNISALYIGTNDISISRCRLIGQTYLGRNFNTGPTPVSNINFFGCFITTVFFDYGQVSNLFLSNNIFYNVSLSLTISAGLFSNNVVLGNSPSLGSFLIKNNIFSGFCSTSSGSIYQNNLFSASSCNISGSGNLFGVNMSNVFVNLNGGSITADNQLVLKAGSPAIGAGLTSDNQPTDAGVFGGDPGFIYKLSGIPPVPAIYKLTAPSQNAVSNPYTITVSIRSNN